MSKKNRRLFYRFGISDGFECIETAETPVEAMEKALRIANWLKFPVSLNEFVPPRRLVNSRKAFPWAPTSCMASASGDKRIMASKWAGLSYEHEKSVIEVVWPRRPKQCRALVNTIKAVKKEERGERFPAVMPVPSRIRASGRL